MRIRLSVPDHIIDGPTIDAALEAVTRGNQALAARGLLPDLGEELRKGLRWKPEPWLGERFDLATDCAQRGWGDCDDLGPWLAAQLRESGEDARAFVKKSGKNRWHVQVEREDGRILDPSVWAGMPQRGGGKPLAVVGLPSVAGPGRTSICAVPYGGQWHVRADMPLTERVHISGWGRDTDASLALERAIGSYAAVSEGCHGIGDETLGVGLADIVSAVAPMAGAARGGPLGGMQGSAVGPMAGGILDSAIGEGPEPGYPIDQAVPSLPLRRTPGRPAPILVPGPPPGGWPARAVTHQIPGPAGSCEARFTHTPGGGPIILRF